MMRKERLYEKYIKRSIDSCGVFAALTVTALPLFDLMQNSCVIYYGVINTLVGMFILFGLNNLAHCSYWVSSAAHYIFTSIMSFFLKEYFSFQKQGTAFLEGAVLCD